MPMAASRFGRTASSAARHAMSLAMTPYDLELPAFFEEIAVRPWNSRSFTMPAWYESYPTMLTREEMRMLAWLAEHVRAAGAIVDCGCFLGGSTVSLALGVARSASGKIVHAYDRFQINEKLKFDYLYRNGQPFAPGTDALPVFERLTRRFAEHISPHPGDILDASWPDIPISVLFIDIAKTRRVNDHLLKVFFPWLSVGGIVVQQDFLFFRNPWLHWTMFRLRDCLRLLTYTQDNSVVFGVERVPTAAEMASACSTDVDAEPLRDAIGYFRGRFHDRRQTEMLDAMLAAVAARPNAQSAWDLPNPFAIVADRHA